MPTKTIRALNKPLAKTKTEQVDKKEAASRTKATTARKPRASATKATRSTAASVPATPEMPWKRMDLHLHTPGSHDYEQPDKGYLDILKQAERRGLDMIGFTDHNTVNGYKAMQREIEDLELLERLGRIRPDELGRLNEYRRLLKKIQVLPGFEFTATFGFHILGLFPPEKSVRDIERILLDLKVPARVIDKGMTEAGATSDVLEAYRRIDEAGGMAIAAHANSSAGVAMRDLRLGGQTRIAFTQDPHLRAIEFTDLDKGSRSSSRLFTGVRAEYSRRMHLIQGSDAHSVVAQSSGRPGVGDRATEVQVEELTFESLRAIFLSEDFDKIRPAKEALNVQPDILQMARAAGEGPTVSFVPSLTKKAESIESILQHVVAMANGEGGYIFVGCEAKPSPRKATALKDAGTASEEIGEAITQRIFPIPYVTVDLQPGDKDSEIIRVSVPRSLVAPHALDNKTILVRDGAESRAASRDEIMSIARRILEPQILAQAAAQQPQQRDPLPPQREQPRQNNFGRQQQGQHGNRSGQQQQPQQQQGQHRGQRDGRGQHQGQGQAHGGRQGGQGARDGQNVRPPLQRRDVGNRNGGRGFQASPSGYPRDEEEEAAVQRPMAQVEEVAAPVVSATPVDAVVTPVVSAEETTSAPRPAQGTAAQAAAQMPPAIPPAEGAPRTGVEIAAVDVRDGIRYFTLRDLRNGSLVRNVTFKSARDLWHYALKQHATGAYAPEKIQWTGDRAVLSRSERAGKMRYDLALRDAEGNAHVFFGVIEEGMDAAWRDLVGAEPPFAPEPPGESVATGEESMPEPGIEPDPGLLADGPGGV